jgi:phytoene/squalene synthetase
MVSTPRSVSITGIKKMSSRGQLRPDELNRTDPFAIAEAIASRDRNNLYITSTFFQHPARYEAFCAYYALMRVVDDRIDTLRATGHLSLLTRQRELDVVAAWEEALKLCSVGDRLRDSQVEGCQHKNARALLEAVRGAYQRLPVMPSLWTDFFAAMRSDLTRTGFATWNDFLAYAEGATVAPTTIYLSIIAARLDGEARQNNVPEGFDLEACGRHLGLFAYLGHIMRDLAVDLKDPNGMLMYLTDDDMRAHGVSRSTLCVDLAGRRASPSTRRLVREILERAHWHLAEGRRLIRPVERNLSNDCRFILELIITLYERLIMKIVACGYDPLGDRHWLTPEDQRAITREVADQTGYSLS